MKKVITIVVGILVCLSAFSVNGCTDGVRQTMTPYVISGLGEIVDGLLQGLSEALYPEGTGETTNSD